MLRRSAGRGEGLKCLRAKLPEVFGTDRDHVRELVGFLRKEAMETWSIFVIKQAASVVSDEGSWP